VARVISFGSGPLEPGDSRIIHEIPGSIEGMVTPPSAKDGILSIEDLSNPEPNPIVELVEAVEEEVVEVELEEDSARESSEDEVDEQDESSSQPGRKSGKRRKR
jgi:hypothetical protein